MWRDSNFIRVAWTILACATASHAGAALPPSTLLRSLADPTLPSTGRRWPGDAR